MTNELFTSLLIMAIVPCIAIALVLAGMHMRKHKSSAGLSASSNETSTGTGLIICGGLILATYGLQLFKLFI